MSLFFLLLSSLLIFPSSGCDYYVSEDPSCANETCNNLAYYFSATSINWNNTELCFVPGVHYLQETIVITNVTGLTMKGIGHISQLVCTSDDTAVYILFCNDITISNIELKDCQSSHNASVVIFSHVLKLLMDRVSFTVNGSALSLINTFNVTIKGSTFDMTPLMSSSVIHFTFYDTTRASFGNYYYVQLDNTSLKFAGNVESIFSVSGIQLVLGHSQYSVNVILDSVSIDSVVQSLSNIDIQANTTMYNILIDSLYSKGSYYGLGLLQKGCLSQLTESATRLQTITISNSFFTNSKLFAIVITWESFANGIVIIDSTILSNNTGQVGSAILINQQRVFHQYFLSIFLNNVTVRENKVKISTNVSFQPNFQSAVALTSVPNITFTNCSFIGNKGSGLFIFDSFATFSGTNYFIDNSGYSGGGIAMYGSSYLVLMKDSMLNFTDNHASHEGGAIFISQIILQVYNVSYYDDEILGSCFFQLKDDYPLKKNYFYFRNNTASVGSIVYGGITSNCNAYCIDDSKTIESNVNIYDVSDIVDQPGNSLVTSDARGVCFCIGDVPYCDKTAIHSSVFPGNPLKVSVVITGGVEDNATTGIVKLDNVPHILTKPKCTIISQLIDTSTYKKLRLFLSVDSETNFDSDSKLLIVSIEQCPIGYHLSQETWRCECDFKLDNDPSVTCNQMNGTFTRAGLTWIGVYQNNCTVIKNYCEYCEFNTVNFYLNDTAKQCSLNRAGIYCGQCAEGLSLMLGSNKCGDCSNGYIALFIPFALAGVALVIFIIVLNLTVTTGIINGFLFFANIVKMYQPLFFGINNIPVLSQFISWVNLDLGIETCFFNGMNSCSKIGLQFIFPFYLWFLIIIIIYLSQKFSKLSRLIGNNAVPVLCTLILLSYTKLLRAIVSIFTYTPICSDTMWFIDSNIRYCTGCHLLLFIIAILMLVVLFVPYTLFLILFPLWELCRSKWSFGTKIYLKLKPFFDAYAGPHKGFFRIWPGILIISRIILALVFAAAPDPTIPASMVMAIAAVLILMLSSGSVYKIPKLHNLEIFYLLCLMALVFVLDDDYSNNDLQLQVEEAIQGEAVILAISFIGFLGILAYHIYSLEWVRDCVKSLRKGKHRMIVLRNSNNIKQDSEPARVETTVVNINHSELREPLLDTESN